MMPVDDAKTAKDRKTAFSPRLLGWARTACSDQIHPVDISNLGHGSPAMPRFAGLYVVVHEAQRPEGHQSLPHSNFASGMSEHRYSKATLAEWAE